MATEGTGAAERRATSARAGRSRRRAHRARRGVRAGRHRRIRRDPAHLADADRRTGATRSCACTGTTTRSRRSSARSATSSRCGWGEYAQISSLAVCVNPGRAFNCYWEMPFALAGSHHADERGPRGRASSTTRSTTRSATCPSDAGSLLRPVPSGEPAAQGRGRDDPRRRQRPGPVRRHVLRVGREQQRVVGRGRGQVLHRRRRRVPDDLRHRHRGLLLRLVQLRRRRPVHRVHDAVRRACRRCCGPTAPTGRSSASACTAGTSPTRSASAPTCGSRCRHSAGVEGRRYLQLQDDIATVAYWYQTLPLAPFPALPDRDAREII